MSVIVINRNELELIKKSVDHIEDCSNKIEKSLREFAEGKTLDSKSASLIGNSTGLAVCIRDTWLQPLRGLLEKL